MTTYPCVSSPCKYFFIEEDIEQNDELNTNIEEAFNENTLAFCIEQDLSTVNTVYFL